jgi:uncharacterized DUF497 family protein
LEIEYDENKRRWTLENRGLDFADAPLVFAETHFQIEDNRRNYGELRYRVFGQLNGRRVVVAWTPRGEKRRIIMMRFAHEEEFEVRKASLD